MNNTEKLSDKIDVSILHQNIALLLFYVPLNKSMISCNWELND